MLSSDTAQRMCAHGKVTENLSFKQDIQVYTFRLTVSLQITSDLFKYSLR
jgi:hypothetical protein